MVSRRSGREHGYPPADARVQTALEYGLSVPAARVGELCGRRSAAMQWHDEADVVQDVRLSPIRNARFRAVCREGNHRAGGGIAAVAATNAFRRFLRDRQVPMRVLSLDGIGEEQALAAKVGVPAADLELREWIETVAAPASKIDPRLPAILAALVFSRLTRGEIAARFGLSRFALRGLLSRLRSHPRFPGAGADRAPCAGGASGSRGVSGDAAARCQPCEAPCIR